jgi:nitrogen fixation NifU-like protein
LPSKFDEIEKMIMTEMRKVYSEKAIEYAMNPRNVGRMEKADGFARITGPCGDTMEIYLKIKGGKIVNAMFWTDGCGSSIACGSIATELIKGKSISEALKINSKSLLDVLGGLPDSDIHCSVLVSSTLKAAIQDYVDRRKRE